jgi:hypothetical protein
MVIAPANTGKESNNKKVVTNIDHTNSGNLCINNPGLLILNIVTIKFIDPNIELVPDK